MKKMILKGLVFFLAFVLTVLIMGKIMNKDRENMTMEMAQATLPVVTMEYEGVKYNTLYGYTSEMDVSFQRDTVTMLDEERSANFIVDCFGRAISQIRVEVRSIDGERLIEDSEVSGWSREYNQIYGTFSLKDLLEKEKEYSLAIVLVLDDGEVHYYTRALWSDKSYTKEKLDFIRDFHERLYDRDQAKALTKYLESNSRLQDNKSFHYVNIHSSFKQITWGDLAVKEVAKPAITLKENNGQTASFWMDYQVTVEGENTDTLYRVREFYRIRYTKDRTYLLNYERTMDQIPDVEHMCANDKILLGIVDSNVQMMESGDGNVVAFEVADRLFSYNVTTNKLSELFGFYNETNTDKRDMYDQHDVRILSIDEGGNVYFAVYGYMNRGRHEGKSGIAVYYFKPAYNTVEEIAYIPYDKPYSVLKCQMENLLFVNREGNMYLSLENHLYLICLEDREVKELVELTRDDSLYVSDGQKMVVWKTGSDMIHCRELKILDLNTDNITSVWCGYGESMQPLGFMGEDIIYGVAKDEDIQIENLGHVTFPMYKICICNADGEILKEYRQDGYYVTGCTMEDNQITLTRVQKNDSGSYKSAIDDHIVSSVQEVVGKNLVVAADIDVYERYVQIQVRKDIDTKTLQLLTPKEVLLEGGRAVNLAGESDAERYYVYNGYGVSGIYTDESNAVAAAYTNAGTVINELGQLVWVKSARVSKNQIMAIKEPEQKVGIDESLGVCLDTILKFEGIVGNSAEMLERGMSAIEVLERQLPDARILDLNTCTLDAVLYYVNQDIPVLAILNNGDAVVITGFNEQNVVLFEPSSGKLYKKGMNDSTKWFSENGNCFITYIE